MSISGGFVPNYGYYFSRRISKTSWCRPRCSKTIDSRKKHKTLSSYIFVMAVVDLRLCTTSRALSLRNLVSGYERGRVFPAGVGPGSPSRDAANWLPSRSDLSVETRRQYGWLRMVFSGVRLFRAPIWWPSGGWRHARGREHCRGEPGGSLSGGYAPDSAKAGGSSIVDEPGEG